MAATVVDAPGRRGVLDAAAELFVTHGYEGTSLRTIAAAAGIKAGSIYHHFASKETLFLAVLRDGMTVMVEAFDRAAERADAGQGEADTGDRLRAHVRAHLGAIFENGPYTTAHVTSFFIAPIAVRDQIVPDRDAYEHQWAELFAELFPENSRRDLRLKRLILFGAMNSTAEWFDPTGNVSLEQLAITISDHFLHGMTVHGNDSSTMRTV